MMWVMLLFVAACGGDKKKPRALGDPVSIAEAAWARTVPFALQGSYSIAVSAPELGVAGTARGGLLVHRPHRFRLEVFSPLGSPLFYAASGDALSLYLVTERLWLGSDDAEGLLRKVTKGAAGVETRTGGRRRDGRPAAGGRRDFKRNQWCIMGVLLVAGWVLFL